MGGMRVLEWVAGHPDRVERALVLASTAVRDGRPGGVVPAAAARDPLRPGVPGWRLLRPATSGRSPAWASRGGSRTPPTATRPSSTTGSAAGRRGGEDPLGGGGRYDVESYLDHHAAKLARRFDPNSYVVLTEAMNSHDVGRGRGGARRPRSPGTPARCTSPG